VDKLTSLPETPAAGLDDRESLEGFQRGDPEAVARLYDRTNAGLFTFVRSLIRDSASSEDVVHETFLRLLEAHPKSPIQSLHSFIYRIARNLALDVLRERARKSPRPPEPPPSRDPSGPDREPGVAWAALDQLEDDQRETVVLKVFGGLTFLQIGEVMSVPVGTAASRYRYALEKLAEFLRDK